MPGLHELPPADRERLTAAFAKARELWGSRARLARELPVDASSIQTLEGKRVGPLSEQLINRMTVAVGWRPDIWREVASGAVEYDPYKVTASPADEALAELRRENATLAQRVEQLEQTIDEIRQTKAGES